VRETRVEALRGLALGRRAERGPDLEEGIHEVRLRDREEEQELLELADDDGGVPETRPLKQLPRRIRRRLLDESGRGGGRAIRR
jgi:hypothetical protein